MNTSDSRATVDENLVEQFVTAISDYARKARSGITYVELMRACGDKASGNLAIAPPGYENMVIWSGMSREFVHAIDTLRRGPRQILDENPSSQLPYVLDDQTLNLPLVTRLHKYKTPHWVPTVFNLLETDAG